MTTALDRPRETAAVILAALTKLALARSATFDQAQQRVYLEALAGTDAPLIARACLYLSRQPKDPYGPNLPTVGDILAVVQRLNAEAVRVEQARSREWKIECDRCDDTGFVVYTCRDTARCGRRICDAMGLEHTHTYTEICPCRPSNRTWTRNHPIVLSGKAS